MKKSIFHNKRKSVVKRNSNILIYVKKKTYLGVYRYSGKHDMTVKQVWRREEFSKLQVLSIIRDARSLFRYLIFKYLPSIHSHWSGATHVPCPVQFVGHSGCSQPRPDHPLSHVQVPCTQTPWLVQLEGQTTTSQLTPRYPDWPNKLFCRQTKKVDYKTVIECV